MINDNEQNSNELPKEIWLFGISWGEPHIWIRSRGFSRVSRHMFRLKPPLPLSS
ncbi:hypothetical protein MNBD_CHLOROFLEXI01-4222 [hydrothermal vent metagenome]|uniref:Uncharacterized protein n=1 Tax=hydrothermal vent metagenome TaxID=652676 RepID=A0A3B0UGZ5_9ZZZZ